ncbi:MAG TPA: uroporphyrinogen-III decarboxylase-like protein [Planctomycetes bacterium]|nr:uroporphyrinogen-III decarboxylase-like protein [Planctomycetota bacterium]
MFERFSIEVKPDAGAFIDLIAGRKKPQRVHYAELFLDGDVEAAIAKRFGLVKGLDPSAPFFELARRIKVQRFLGYDYVYQYHFAGLEFPRPTDSRTADTSQTEIVRKERAWVNEHRGPVTTWEEFEKYPWPKPGMFDTSSLEWLEKNLPDGMCMTSRAHSVFEELSWLMGLETLAFALYDTPDLVKAVADRAGEIFLAAARVHVQFDKMKFLFGGDDMGHKTATLVSPDDLRKYVLPWHRKIAEVSHEAGRPYVLHSCGNLEAIMPDLVEDVKIDGRHSYEDAIEPVESIYRRWGGKVAILGGIDVDFLCRSSEEAIRGRVRKVLSGCHPGRYALGTGNSVANYIPIDNYLVMLDEGRKYSA